MPFNKANLKALSNAVTDPHENFVVSTVNESCLRLAVFEGEYPWHFHPDADELFLVLEGALTIAFEDREAVTLQPYDALTVPAGVVHKTMASTRTVNLCFEHEATETVFVDPEEAVSTQSSG